MYTLRRMPISMPLEHLDAYLANGWYRMGQTIFTCQFLCAKERIFSTIWLRLDLKKHKFSKSQRKIMRRNEKTFEVIIGPATIDAEKEKLFKKYKANFDGYLSPTLKHALQDNTNRNIYNTFECCIYEEERLIGLSYFDLGVKAIASIKGVYDPDYSKYSLGFYTMLLEMQFGIENGYQFYYPGYVVPGYPKFDYKTRIGATEFYSTRRNEWQSYEELTDDDIPLQFLRNKLTEVGEFLAQRKISTEQVMYPLYEANMMGYWEENLLEHPLFIICFPERKGLYYQVLTYDLRNDTYLLYKCAPSEELTLMMDNKPGDILRKGDVNLMLDLLVKKQKLIESTSLKEVAETIQL